MSLSPRERRALDSIRDRLSGSDPELAALLATFTRLASGEEMQARGRSGRAKGGILTGKIAGPRTGCTSAWAFYQLALLLSVVITIALITTAMAFDRSSQDGCSWVTISAAIQRSCSAHDTAPQAEPPATR